MGDNFNDNNFYDNNFDSNNNYSSFNNNSDSDFDMDQFNALIQTANDSISCDAACMQNREEQSLRQQYLDAETNLVNGPQQLYSAKKKYITFTQGENGYNEYISNEIEQQANTIVTTYQAKLKDTISMIRNLFKSYESLFINYGNVADLYKKYKQDNNDIENKFKTTVSDTITNDRKTYYEDEDLNRLKNYYYFFIFIYLFVVFVFFISIFLVDSNFRLITRIFILLLLIIYPFICYFSYQLIEKTFNYFKSYLPNNVYKTL
jgi:hypothetical protein